MRRARLACCLALSIWVGTGLAAVQAQENPAPIAASAILTIDPERLYAGSAWGKRALADLEAASSALQAENRKIEEALTAEEKTLTERRPAMVAEDFRKLADEFDARVSSIRTAQDTKARNLTNRRDADRQAFFDAALPVMGEVMAAHGAVAILDKRAIFLSAKSIDITDAVSLRLDEKLGAGP